jgi:hypothetical protein
MLVNNSVLASQVSEPVLSSAGLDAASQYALDSALQVGRSSSQPLTNALQAWWRLLSLADATARAAVSDHVRRAVRNGDTSLRAWVPIALGEFDFALTESAVLGYLGTGPVSVERRAQAVADVLDWIRRDLPLNRAAAFAALLSLHDESVDAALAGLRGRLGTQESAAVWQRLAGDRREETRQFIAEWRIQA